MHDLVVRGGTIVDGRGARRSPATSRSPTASSPDRLAGSTARRAKNIDADGLLVTPGFVDVHTHYDGQATWDSQLAPVRVGTGLHHRRVVRGPGPARRPGGQQELIELMEGVEDIPGTAPWEGIDWRWESFPEYLDVVERRPRMVDVGTHVPHAAVRAYVMGWRAGSGVATPDDVAAMVDIARGGDGGRRAGVSTSRILAHHTSRGDEVPGTFADETELTVLGVRPARASAPACSRSSRGHGRRGERRRPRRARAPRPPGRGCRHPPHLLGGADPHRARPLARHPRPVRRAPRAGRPDLPAGRVPRHRDPVRAPEAEQRVLHPPQLP